MLRETRRDSLETAVVEMTGNPGNELDRFEQGIEDDPSVAQVAWKDGSKGGGGAFLWLLPAVVLVRAAAKRPAGEDGPVRPG